MQLDNGIRYSKSLPSCTIHLLTEPANLSRTCHDHPREKIEKKIIMAGQSRLVKIHSDLTDHLLWWVIGKWEERNIKFGNVKEAETVNQIFLLGRGSKPCPRICEANVHCASREGYRVDHVQLSTQRHTAVTAEWVPLWYSGEGNCLLSLHTLLKQIASV